MLNKTIASPRCGAVIGAVAAAGAAEDAKPQGIEPAGGGGVHQCLAGRGRAAAAAGDPLNTRT